MGVTGPCPGRAGAVSEGAVEPGVVLVEGPLGHVPQHVVEAPGVGGLGADRVEYLSAVGGIPPVRVERARIVTLYDDE